MQTYPNSRHIPYAPTETADLYPESDGKPMAETDMHAVAIIDLRQRFDGFFADNPDTYVSGTLMMYDIEGPRSHGCFARYPRLFRHRQETSPHL